MKGQVVIAAGLVVLLAMVAAGYFVIASSTDRQQPTDRSLDLSGDDVGIYSAAFQLVAGKHDSTFMVLDHTRPFHPDKDIVSVLDGISKEYSTAVDDLFVHGGEERSLLQLSSLGFEMLNGATLDHKWRRDGRRVNSVLFSVIGYNDARDLAIVYVWETCDGLCGGSGFVLLELRRGKWGVKRYLGVDVS